MLKNKKITKQKKYTYIAGIVMLILLFLPIIYSLVSGIMTFLKK